VLGVEAISTLLWQVGTIAWERAGYGLGDMVVPETELVLVWFILDSAIHGFHCNRCEVQHLKLKCLGNVFDSRPKYLYI